MTTSALLSALRGAGRRQITASTVAARQATGSHVLRVDGFTRVREKAANGTAVLSSRFGVGGHDWHIMCYPNGDTEKAEGHISLYLRKDSHVKTGDAIATYKLSILDKAGQPSCTLSEKEHCFKGSGRGWDKFMKLDDLDGDNYLKDDCLSVLCDVTVDLGLHTDDYTGEVATAEQLKSTSPPFDLHGFALPEAIWNKQAADVMIHVGDDGQMIAAHQWVLEARSPVFKADLALASSAGENIAELRVDGMDADVCKALLRFIYTDSPPPEFDAATMMAERLLVAADRYELEKLKLACEDALCKKIDTSSVVAALALAERHRCPALKEACMQFLSSPDNLKAVMASDGFEHLKTGCPSALLELLVKNMPTHEPPISTSSQLFSYVNHTK